MTPANRRLHTLPAEISSFVGRQRDIAEIVRRLEATRLLTLTGGGGIGKSRLAARVAAVANARYSGGVWLAGLADLTDPSLVAPSLAKALGLVDHPGRPLLYAVVAFLRRRSLMLVLDNCEHLIAACAEITDRLLRECPGLTILATSREALGITGETTWLVPSLSTPDPRQPGEKDDLCKSESVQLFIERATAVRADFSLTDHNARAVAQICHGLDGSPLALELAATRVKAMSVEQIALRLEHPFVLLVGGSRTAPPRHQTLEAAFDWSYDLLSAPQQALFRRLAVFAGGWTLEAAEAILGQDVTDLLGQLVDKSLLLLDEPEQEGRYRFLESVRQFAERKLRATDEEEVYRRRHFDWCLALAEQTEPHFWRAGQWVCCFRLERELENVRAAIAWSRMADERAELGLRLVGALWHFWDMMGHLDEANEVLEALLAVTSERIPDVALAPDQSTEDSTRVALPAGLTPRELEVLRLIAGGRSNREIAEELVLSVRTVERHITNLYAKVGARGKADATAFALRGHLA